MAYPSNLPKPIARGYGFKPVDPSIRTDMDVGAARVRRRTAAVNDRFTFNWLLTDTQMGTFRDWFDNAVTGADGGVAWTALSMPVGRGGTSNIEFRFIGAYTANASGGLIWSVSAEVEVRSA